jgi:ATP phosphoribosyltransferase
LGIVGENVIEETEVDVNYLQRLGFGKCSLKIAVPNNNTIQHLSQLNGKSIATSYPVILGKYLKKEGIQADIREISGSVEISPGLGLADVICDLVSTGGTLRSNGLIPFADVMSSEAVLICSKSNGESELVKELVQRVQSVLRAKETKYVVLNVHKDNLSAITALLPGVKSPSVVPLAEADWVAVHTVIPERDFWDRISQLKQAGAQGIVVMPIEKIIL